MQEYSSGINKKTNLDLLYNDVELPQDLTLFKTQTSSPPPPPKPPLIRKKEKERNKSRTKTRKSWSRLTLDK